MVGGDGGGGKVRIVTELERSQAYLEEKIAEARRYSIKKPGPTTGSHGDIEVYAAWLERLLAVNGATVTPEQLYAALPERWKGNMVWESEIHCSACGERSASAVEVVAEDAESSDGSPEVVLCAACLRVAITLAESERE